MQAEGELRSNLEESDRVRELQDKVADLKAEVRNLYLHLHRDSPSSNSSSSSNFHTHLNYCSPMN
jgi:hypothetical protein